MIKERQLAVLGSGGYIGSFLAEKFDEVGTKVSTLHKSDLDLSDLSSLEQWVMDSPNETIVNLAGFTDVARAEKVDFGELVKINSIVPGLLAKYSKESGKHLIHFSSDFVFPNTPELRGPYSNVRVDLSSFDFMGAYAKTKLLGEIYVGQENPDAAIVRISYPFGGPLNPEKDYLLKLMKRALNGDGVFNDQFLTPTYLPDVAPVITKIAEQKMSGIYHVATYEAATPYEIATYLFKQLGISKKIKESSAIEFYKDKNGPPINGGLETSVSERNLGVSFTEWHEAVELFVENLPSNFSLSDLVKK